MRIFGLVSLFVAISHVLADPFSGDLNVLLLGNKAFRDTMAATEPGFLQDLADAKHLPPFMFLGCSDPRVAESIVFDATLGMLFTQRNIANQFLGADAAAQASLAYAVATLGVKHVVVMGHYGCRGIAAAIADPPHPPVDAANGAVQNWVEPIREIFRTSTRPEIVAFRNNTSNFDPNNPDINNPGYRALVEENVKASVRHIAKNPIITNKFALLNTTGTGGSGAMPPVQPVFIHGWVYDLVTGDIRDLGISVGPPSS